MKRMLLLSAVAFVLAFGPAMASNQSSKASNTKDTHKMTEKHQMAGHRITGTMKSWNGSQLSVSTAAGKEETFVLAPDATRPDSLTNGSHVTVWYKETNGQKTASRIALAGNQSMAQRTKASKHSHRGPSSGQSGS